VITCTCCHYHIRLEFLSHCLPGLYRCLWFSIIQLRTGSTTISSLALYRNHMNWKRSLKSAHGLGTGCKFLCCCKSSLVFLNSCTYSTQSFLDREPPLGTISFVLLTFQVARSNMQNIGAKPYTARVKQWRAEQLAAAFPQYDASILIQYSNNTSLQESKTEIDNA
jgi:hypothetical protein